MLDRLLVNWPLKLLALVLAVAIWAAIMGEDELSRDLTVPLQARISERHDFLEPPPNRVDVRLVGPESSMRKVDPLRIRVLLDLEDAAPGPHDIRLSEMDLDDIPAGVRVAFFSPARVRVEIDRKRRVDVPVKVNLVGSPPPGHHIYKTRVRPQRLPVEGPESAVEALAEIPTGPVPLGRRTRTFDTTVQPVPDVPRVRLVDPASLVEIRVVIDAPPDEARLERIPIIFPGQSYDVAAERRAIGVTVTGPPALLDVLKPENVRAVAEIGDDLGPGRHRVGVRAEIIDLPEDQLDCLAVESTSPASIDVRLTEPISEPS